MPSLRIPRRNISATLTPPPTEAHCIDDCPTLPPVTAPSTIFDPRSPQQQQQHPRALVRLHGITFSVLLPVHTVLLLPMMQMQLEHMVAAAASGRTRVRGNIGFALERRRRRRWQQQQQQQHEGNRHIAWPTRTLIPDDSVEAILIDDMLFGWSEDLAAALDHYTSVLSQERASLIYLMQHGGKGREASIKVRRAKRILKDSMKGRKKDLKALQGLKRIIDNRVEELASYASPPFILKGRRTVTMTGLRGTLP